MRSTIGAVGLNFSVRNGKRWNPDAITTGNNVDILNLARNTVLVKYAFNVCADIFPFDAG